MSLLTARARRAASPTSPAALRRLSDEDLVARFRAGSQDAFDVMHDRHRDALVRYARQMLRAQGGAAADDVVQDVLVRAHRALLADDRPMRLRSWLYRIAHNRCLDELRGAHRTVEHDEQITGAGIAGEGTEDPHAAAVRREHLRDVVADIGALPATQRSALVLRELGGLSYEEMAEALDATVPAVKSLLVRARTKLADAAARREERTAALPSPRPALAPRPAALGA